jgi:hypothetical protein
MLKPAAYSLVLAALVGTLLLAAEQFPANLGLLDTTGPIPFYIEDGNGVPGYQTTDRELARMALEAWSRESGAKLKFIEAAEPGEALVQLRWVSANSGLFGRMERLHVNGKTGALVYVMPEVTSLSPALASHTGRDSLLRDTIVYLTCVHELGHAVGMPHTSQFDDIMYSFGYGGNIVEYFVRYRNKLASRNDISKLSGLSAADIAYLRQLYR